MLDKPCKWIHSACKCNLNICSIIFKPHHKFLQQHVGNPSSIYIMRIQHNGFDPNLERIQRKLWNCFFFLFECLESPLMLFCCNDESCLFIPWKNMDRSCDCWVHLKHLTFQTSIHTLWNEITFSLFSTTNGYCKSWMESMWWLLYWLVGWCIYSVFLLVTTGTWHYRNTDAIFKTTKIFLNHGATSQPMLDSSKIWIGRLNVLKANKEWDSPTLFRTS
jgi:hypothetical protein